MLDLSMIQVSLLPPWGWEQHFCTWGRATARKELGSKAPGHVLRMPPLQPATTRISRWHLFNGHDSPRKVLTTRHRLLFAACKLQASRASAPSLDSAMHLPIVLCSHCNASLSYQRCIANVKSLSGRWSYLTQFVPFFLDLHNCVEDERVVRNSSALEQKMCVRVRVWTARPIFFYAGFACGPSLLIWTGVIQRHSSLCDWTSSVLLTWGTRQLDAEGWSHVGECPVGWRFCRKASSFQETWSFLRCTGFIQCRGFCGDFRTSKKHPLKTSWGFFFWRLSGNIALWSFKARLTSVCI